MYVVVRETTRRAKVLGMEHGEFAPDCVFGPFRTRKEAVQFRASRRDAPGTIEYWVLPCTSVPTN